MRPIDADALMKAMYHRAFETDGDTMWQSGCWVRYRAIEQVVKEQPSADVQPVRHGKWIKAQPKGITSYGDGFAECNKCHKVSWLGWNDKYCRNCGARMECE